MPISRDIPRTRFEGSAPILSVTDMSASLHFYVDVLGFRNADWGSDAFTAVNRDAAGIYLCRGGQGSPGTWAWVGVEERGQDPPRATQLSLGAGDAC